MKKSTTFLTYWLFCFHIAFLAALTSIAQTPRNVPQGHDSEPVQFDTAPNLIMYIIIPVILVILYLLWRRREKRRNR